MYTRTGRYEHITPVLRELHWLPYPHRIIFKICLTTYRCLHDLVSDYFKSVCYPVSTTAGRVNLWLPVWASCKSLTQKQRILETGVSAFVTRANGTYFPLNYVMLG